MILRLTSFLMNKDALSFLSCRSSLRLAVRRLCHAADSRQSHNALLNPTSVSQSAMFQLHALWLNLAGTDCEHRGTIDICDFSPHLTTILPALILNTRPDPIQLHRCRLHPGQAIHHDPQAPVDDHTRARLARGSEHQWLPRHVCVVCEGEGEGRRVKCEGEGEGEGEDK